MSDKPKLQCTKDYSLFLLSEDNRPINTDTYRYRMLRQDMIESGFLPTYPIWCYPKGNRLVIFDGHRRYTAAAELKIPLWYMIYDPRDLDISRLQEPIEKWKLPDYVGRQVQKGNTHYRQLDELHKQFNLSLSKTAGLLVGNGTGNLDKKLRLGEFCVKDRDGALVIVSILSELRPACKIATHSRFINALKKCLSVKQFDPSVFVEKAKKQPGRLVAHADSSGYLQMIEDIYNFASRKPIPLAFEASHAQRKT